MPDISTANQDRISAMCPLGYEFNIGGRISYLTTAGALSSATITAGAMSSGTITDGTFTSVNILSMGAQIASAASGTTAIVDKTAMTAGQYLLYPVAGSSNGFHLTSAASSGTWVRLINYATASTAIISWGCTEGVAEMAYIASSTGYFNFTLRANAAVDLFAPSATRWVIVGATVGVEAFSAAT